MSQKNTAVIICSRVRMSLHSGI